MNRQRKQQQEQWLQRRINIKQKKIATGARAFAV